MNGFFGTSIMAGAIVAAAFCAPVTASAQEDGTKNDVPGRYAVVDTKIGEQDASVLLDTAYGRTWILVADDDGTVAWKRIFFDSASETVPDGMGRRPSRLRN